MESFELPHSLDFQVGYKVKFDSFEKAVNYIADRVDECNKIAGILKNIVDEIDDSVNWYSKFVDRLEGKEFKHKDRVIDHDVEGVKSNNGNISKISSFIKDMNNMLLKYAQSLNFGYHNINKALSIYTSTLNKISANVAHELAA